MSTRPWFPFLLLSAVLAVLTGCDEPTGQPTSRQAPRVTITSPADGAFLPPDSVLITGQATGSSGVRRAAYQVNGGPEVELPITPGRTAPFSASVALNPRERAEVRVIAYDALGNRGASRVVLVPDTMPPAFTAVMPEWASTPERKVLVFARAVDQTEVARVTLAFNGGPEQDLPVVCPFPSSDCVFAGQAHWGHGREVALQSGENTALLAAYDRVGNRAAFEIRIRHIPRVTIEGTEQSADTLVVRGRASFLAPLTRVVYHLNGGPEQVAVAGAADTLVAFSLRVALRPSGNQIRIAATDGNGNQNATEATFVWEAPDPVPGRFARIAVGEQHSCGLLEDGRLFCWGKNADGELGTGDTERRQVPAPVAGGLRFQSMALGTGYSCALDTGGAAYCWGENLGGQLGTGGREGATVPTPVAGGLRFATLSAGGSATCGITSDGVAYCWGAGPATGGPRTETCTRFSRSFSCSLAPVPVAGGLRFRQIVMGRAHACGLTPEGVAYCWGVNGRLGALGTGDMTDAAEPVPVLTSLRFRSVSAGATHSCAVTEQDEAYCWGLNESGEVGSEASGEQLVPVPVQGGLRFREVSAGAWFTCGVTPENKAYCWGANGSSAALGTGTAYGPPLPPTPVAGGQVLRSVASSQGRHSCAVTVAGAGYCWGDGRHGKLGYGQSGNVTAPIRIVDPP